jgi:hypothetical protein
MKDKRNLVIATLILVLAFSAFINMKELGSSKNPTPYHEEVTIAFQTCMNLYTNQPPSFMNASPGWASANTKKAILECAEYANDMDKRK